MTPTEAAAMSVRLDGLQSEMTDLSQVMVLSDNPEIQEHGTELDGAAKRVRAWAEGIAMIYKTEKKEPTQ